MTTPQALEALKTAIGEPLDLKTSEAEFVSWIDDELPETIEEVLVKYTQVSHIRIGNTVWEPADLGQNLRLALSGNLQFAYPGTSITPTIQLCNHGNEDQVIMLKSSRCPIRYVASREATMGYCVQVIGTSPVFQSGVLMGPPEIVINVHVWQCKDEAQDILSS